MRHIYPDTIVGRISALHLICGLVCSFLLILLFGLFCSSITIPKKQPAITQVVIHLTENDDADEIHQPENYVQIYEYPQVTIKQESHSVQVYEKDTDDEIDTKMNDEISLLTYLFQSGLPF